VDAALEDWRRLLEYEREFGTVACVTPALDDERNRSMFAMYENWAADARQVLDRVRQMAASGRSIANLEDLEDAYGRVRARLGLTPEMVSQAMAQVRQGQARPLKDLRDELFARSKIAIGRAPAGMSGTARKSSLQNPRSFLYSQAT
jgi:hypothetical protein